jgi:hypothetical protein
MSDSPSSGVSEVADLLKELVGLQGKDRAPALSSLLVLDGRDRHEDIVFELGLLESADAVPFIAKAGFIPFPHLIRWGNLHEFQRKCAYALARIGTTDSRAVLVQLSQDGGAHLHEYGDEGLEHWPLKRGR